MLNQTTPKRHEQVPPPKELLGQSMPKKLFRYGVPADEEGRLGKKYIEVNFGKQRRSPLEPLREAFRKAEEGCSANYGSLKKFFPDCLQSQGAKRGGKRPGRNGKRSPKRHIWSQYKCVDVVKLEEITDLSPEEKNKIRGVLSRIQCGKESHRNIYTRGRANKRTVRTYRKVTRTYGKENLRASSVTYTSVSSANPGARKSGTKKSNSMTRVCKIRGVLGSSSGKSRNIKFNLPDRLERMFGTKKSKSERMFGTKKSKSETKTPEAGDHGPRRGDEQDFPHVQFKKISPNDFCARFFATEATKSFVKESSCRTEAGKPETKTSPAGGDHDFRSSEVQNLFVKVFGTPEGGLELSAKSQAQVIEALIQFDPDYRKALLQAQMSPKTRSPKRRPSSSATSEENLMRALIDLGCEDALVQAHPIPEALSPDRRPSFGALSQADEDLSRGLVPADGGGDAAGRANLGSFRTKYVSHKKYEKYVEYVVQYNGEEAKPFNRDRTYSRVALESHLGQRPALEVKDVRKDTRQSMHYEDSVPHMVGVEHGHGAAQRPEEGPEQADKAEKDKVRPERAPWQRDSVTSDLKPPPPPLAASPRAASDSPQAASTSPPQDGAALTAAKDNRCRRLLGFIKRVLCVPEDGRSPREAKTQPGKAKAPGKGGKEAESEKESSEKKTQIEAPCVKTTKSQFFKWRSKE